jgi:hypothetical protein
MALCMVRVASFWLLACWQPAIAWHLEFNSAKCGLDWLLRYRVIRTSRCR